MLKSMTGPRAMVVVLDGCGAGATPDAAEFGDGHGPSTLRHVWEAVGGFDAPTLARVGFLAAGGIPVEPGPGAAWGRLRPLSRGKDSVTGHWEMMGITVTEPFPTYPDGFPIPLIKAFEDAIGTQTLGNRPASGTRILEDLGALHVDTGFPIVYTSADSVFQVAAHEDVIPVEQLHAWCDVARHLCQAPNNVQRVIARPFIGNPKDGWTRTERRKDYPVIPPRNLVDEVGDAFGVGVVSELFGNRGYRPVRRTQSNPAHAELLNEALTTDARFIFANFEDFDMLFGHRSDPVGFARCLETFDPVLASLIERLRPEDLLIVTADHGNDPTDPSTDHTREYVPFVMVGAGVTPGPLGDQDGLAHVGEAVARHLGVTLPRTQVP